MKQDKKIYIILSIIGIIPIVWLALLIAPLLDGGLAKIINELPLKLNNPFNIELCENSKKTILFFYFPMLLELEHISLQARWGNPNTLNKKYKQLPESENRILTQNTRLGLNAKKHRRNLNTIVIGGSRCRKNFILCQAEYFTSL